MSLDSLRERMDWPAADDILNPSGAGPRVLAQLAREKIQRTLQRSLGDGAVQVGLLTKNPHSPSTEAPIAVVCEFSRQIDAKICSLAHRLAWLFTRTPLLITIEPHLVRTWSCCIRPEDDPQLLPSEGEIEDAELDLTVTLTPSEQAAHALHWVRLATGDFYRRFPERFQRDGRADRVLLQQLTVVRRRLKNQGLDDDTIHDLLARVVFAQFLFDRKDADGRAALNPSLLAKLRADGYLLGQHSGLGTILADYAEAYRFFRWLNDKFNGDLFPGKGKTKAERESEWRAECDRVKPPHLKTMADFVSGRNIGKQKTLWKLYSFDVIPLEFISSIYEEFVTSTGAHYTPPFLVDFMLDEVLSWDGIDWNLKILDPACGSGIFLVKAYQRLIQRWKNTHPNEKPPTKLLRRLLTRNLFGVDIDKHAVRVASFSLYLTMCDEIDPKSYLKNTKFPRLRGTSLVQSDFFEENQPGFRTDADAAKYHRVVGNAPWGEESATGPAKRWANCANRKWDIVDKGLGTLFLPKAAALTKPDGRVSMIQPAGSLLFNRSGPACRFRKRLFEEFKVEEVVNLAALRFELFGNVVGQQKHSVSPACIVTLRSTGPDSAPLVYISPKEVTSAVGAEVGETNFAVVVEPHDISGILPEEAATDPYVWTALAWGGRRDLGLIHRLRGFSNVEKLRQARSAITCEGVIRGNRKNRDESLLKRRVLFEDTFPQGAFLFLNAKDLSRNPDPCFERPRTRSAKAFGVPQLIIKQSLTVENQRFRAVVTIPENTTDGVVCSQSYVSVNFVVGGQRRAESAAISYNSIMAVYFMLLTSGRLASYRPEPLVAEIRSVPFVEIDASIVDGICDFADVDSRIRELFAFKDAEWALIEDLNKYTLPDFKGDESSPGRQPTERKPNLTTIGGREPHLAQYSEYFIRVLKAGFGQDKSVCATIFQDPPEARLPVRLVAIHLECNRKDTIAIEEVDSPELCERLSELNDKFLQTNPPEQGGVFFQRVARIYDETRIGRRTVPTIYIVKPDRIRYWTRSAALRDADEVALDIAQWLESSSARRKLRSSK